ncbi:MAG: MOSC domain-containing protein [Abditibacteriales bacterium]|nr:MOSC domain-containing protein [Abditibacteriales bacterium]MDW8367845.1 MOSC domain-containing protein [Abditibacteriales bacterium]
MHLNYTALTGALEKEKVMPQHGKVVSIYLYPQRGAEPVEVNDAVAIVGKGLDGDQPRAFKRQVTLLSLEAWQQATAELGADLPPCTRRANIVLSGVDLSTTIGKSIRIGEMRLQVHGETMPCATMDAAKQGLKDALTPNMRAGVYGAVLEGGRVAVGDSVRVEE